MIDLRFCARLVGLVELTVEPVDLLEGDTAKNEEQDQKQADEKCGKETNGYRSEMDLHQLI